MAINKIYVFLYQNLNGFTIRTNGDVRVIYVFLYQNLNKNI